MKNHDGTAGRPGAGFDVGRITETVQRALASAGLDTRSGPMKGVTDTIDQALTAAGLMQRSPLTNRGVTIDGTCEVVPNGQTPEAKIRRPGEFSTRSFTNAAGTRAYKVYVPTRHEAASEPMPMVVMLHGCTQSPDDFAAGTRMNALADRHGFVVVYPAQSSEANATRCWNWFRLQDQTRDTGEPSLVAGITREVAALYRIDDRRIFAAGMSAGAAMAVVLGATYPDLFAAIGAHSGLAYGAAHDVPSAFAAMHGGSSPRAAAAGATVPVIVFHGDGDHTVHARNGAAIIEQAIARHDRAPLRSTLHSGIGPGGCTYSRTDHVDAANRVIAEHWVLHGAGHAWSGGSPAGSFTDARGPDASAEMIRFFYSQPRARTA